MLDLYSEIIIYIENYNIVLKDRCTIDMLDVPKSLTAFGFF